MAAKGPRVPARGRLPVATEAEPVSGLTFVLYLGYLCSFFLNAGSRWPALGVIRPTVILLMLISLLLVMQINRLGGRLQGGVSKAMLLLCVWVLISLPFVEYPGSFLRGNWEPLTKSVAFFFFTALVVDTPKRFAVAIATMLSCQLFRVLEPLYMHMTTDYWGDKAYLQGGDFMNRLSGAPSDIVNPNGLGFVIVCIFPFLHYFAFRTHSRLLKGVYFLIAPLLVWALMLTGSRSAAIAFGILVLCIVLWSKRRSMAAVLVIAGVAFIAPRMDDVLVDRYASVAGRGEANAATAEGRFESMRHDFVVGARSPVFGHGVGTSAEARYHAIGHAKISHNMYGEAFIELGAFGLILVGSLLFVIGMSAEQLRRRYSGGAAGVFPSASYALAAWFWASLVFNLAQYGVSEFHWYLMAGLLVAATRMAPDVPLASAPQIARRQLNVARSLR